MSALWTIEEIVAATGGRPVGVGGSEVTAVSIDSREIAPGALFVAIRGDVHDGHDFVGRALEQGASAALVSEDRASGLPQDRLIVVPDALHGLRDLAAAARARSAARIVAVTGSAGKTTTKEMIRTMLGAIGPTHYSIKSFNNHWGVPLMLARLPRDAAFGVFEIGMNHAGEITPLSRLVRPHAAVITTVAAAHLEFFDSVAGIARAKAEIFAGLEPGGVAILNADHEHLGILLEHAAAAGVGRVLTYGFSEGVDWRIEAADQVGDTMQVRLRHDSEIVGFPVAASGRHMVANAVAALAVADVFGIGADAALGGLEAFRPPEGRGLTVPLGPPEKPLLLVDQSYNANVASMLATLEVYARTKAPGGAKVLVLGDMLELGASGPRLHADLAQAVLASGATRIFLVGRAISALADALGPDRVTGHAETIAAIEERILDGLAYGDAVMVKGSKGVQLAGLVAKIRARFGQADAAGART